MPMFRKKPVVIEALHLTADLTKGQVDDFLGVDKEHVTTRFGMLEIHTLEGTMQASPGDWIIRGVKGELYPCKPDIFEATYEAAGEAEETCLCGQPQSAHIGCTWFIADEKGR